MVRWGGDGVRGEISSCHLIPGPVAASFIRYILTEAINKF